MFHFISFIFFVVLLSSTWNHCPVYGHSNSELANSKYFPMLMPDVRPMQPETYLCTAFKMARHEHEFIVEYLPNATKQTAHHILIYGCQSPGYYERDTPHAVWDCGEMTFVDGEYGEDERQFFPREPVCKGQSQIVYSWAMDAPPLKLPNGVGFKVGYGTDINYLVLQVHYAHVDQFINGNTDHSGITLRILPQDNNEINKIAGVLLLATGGYIQARSQEFFDSACQMKESITIYPFAYRTHTHKLGKVVTGYRIDRENRWHLIGKGNPQLPQMFYPVKNAMSIHQGDIVVARCTMYNNQTHMVHIGSTGNDEMCNFYVMYYVDRMDRNLERKICFTVGPPNFYWDNVFDVPKRITVESSMFP